MKLYSLSKVILSFQNNPGSFLNGLASNTIDKPQNAFLNIHGRVIAAFEQLRLNDDEVVVVVEKPFVDEVLSHLERYAKLSGVKIQVLDEKVYFDLDSNVPLAEGDKVITHKKGRLLITKQPLSTNISDEAFKLFRLKNNIPLHGVDFKDEMVLNINETDLISFTKGCFLGQEPVSKVHSRSKPSRVLVVKFEDECTSEEAAKMTSKTLDPVTKRTLGFVFVSNR